MEGIVFLITLLGLTAFQPGSSMTLVSSCPSLDVSCPSKPPEYYLTILNGVFPSEDFLKENCRDILDLTECYTNYLANCGNHSNPFPKEFLIGAKELWTELCNESSSLRSDHRLYSACLGNNTDVILICLMGSSAQFEREKSRWVNDDKIDSFSKEICTVYDFFKECAIPGYSLKCGSKAAEHFGILLAKPFEKLKEAKCSKLYNELQEA